MTESALDIESILNGDNGVGVTATGKAPFIRPANDLVPLVPVDTQLPSLESAEPIRFGVGGKKKPVLTVKGADGRATTYLSFHPAQVYGENFVEEHALAFAAFMRSQLISFVRTVAGMRGLTANDLLQTGFEDLTRLMRETLPKTFDLYLPSTSTFGSAPTSTTRPEGQGGFEDVVESEDEETDTSTNARLQPKLLPDESKIQTLSNNYTAQAISELVNLAELLKGFGDGTDVLRVFRYLQNRQGRYDFAVVKWMTLPMNIGQIYFKDTLKAAIENALAHVVRLRNSPDNGTLFAEILNSDQSNTFAQLVARYLDKFQYNRTYGDKRVKEGEAIEREIEKLAWRLRSEGSPVGSTSALSGPRNAQNTLTSNDFNPM